MIGIGSFIDKIDKEKIQYCFQRFEFKYLFPKKEIDAMYDILLHNHLVRDPFLNDDRDYYTVSSLYFDNADFMCYNEKISGIKNRTKLRLRTYSDGKDLDNIFLEIKRKSDAVVIKDRAKINKDLYFRCLSANHKIDGEEMKNKTVREFVMRQRAYSMEPLVFVRYKRKPLVSRFDNNLRVTFDYDIEASGAKSFTDYNRFNAVNPGEAVMEIKFNNSLPDWLHRKIQKYELCRTAFSKYCFGIDTAKKNYQIKY